MRMASTIGITRNGIEDVEKMVPVLLIRIEDEKKKNIGCKNNLLVSFKTKNTTPKL